MSHPSDIERAFNAAVQYANAKAATGSNIPSGEVAKRADVYLAWLDAHGPKAVGASTNTSVNVNVSPTDVSVKDEEFITRILDEYLNSPRQPMPQPPAVKPSNQHKPLLSRRPGCF